MNRIFILTLLSAGAVFAQPGASFEYSVSASRVGDFAAAKPIQGAPYSATLTNESIQTLADGNRIVQKSSGTTARDSMGRTRNDTVLPMIGNMSAAKAPHLVFIVDPIAQTSYTLNLEDKTAQKGGGPMGFGMVTGGAMVSGIATGPGMPAIQNTQMLHEVKERGVVPATRSSSFTVTNGPGMRVSMGSMEPGELHREELGMKTMEGVAVEGVKTTRTIPAGEIGNEKPIEITTEVWTSPDLKMIVYSKRSDPRMGDQIFRLTNIQRSEPDASLFTVPADFKLSEGPSGDVFFYKPRE